MEMLTGTSARSQSKPEAGSVFGDFEAIVKLEDCDLVLLPPDVVHQEREPNVLEFLGTHCPMLPVEPADYAPFSGFVHCDLQPGY